MDYPHLATRELLMNAICHRDYTGNGPVQFYQYDNRIEILNPGGLYGKANAGNFPKVNDYRNLIVAEGMRVLGFVNRFSRGVLQVEDSLEENGNGLPVFDLELDSAFLVTEYKSNRGEILEKKAIEQGLILKENLTYGESQSDKTDMKKKLGIGVDIGGTNTDFGLVDAEGNIVRRGRLKMAGYDDVAVYVKDLAEALLAALGELDAEAEGIGIGAPNGNFHTSCIEHAPNLKFKGIIPLSEMIRQYINVPVTLSNDANAAAYN